VDDQGPRRLPPRIERAPRESAATGCLPASNGSSWHPQPGGAEGAVGKTRTRSKDQTVTAPQCRTRQSLHALPVAGRPPRIPSPTTGIGVASVRIRSEHLAVVPAAPPLAEQRTETVSAPQPPPAAAAATAQTAPGSPPAIASAAEVVVTPSQVSPTPKQVAQVAGTPDGASASPPSGNSESTPAQQEATISTSASPPSPPMAGQSARNATAAFEAARAAVGSGTLPLRPSWHRQKEPRRTASIRP